MQGVRTILLNIADWFLLATILDLGWEFLVMLLMFKQYGILS